MCDDYNDICAWLPATGVVRRVSNGIITVHSHTQTPLIYVYWPLRTAMGADVRTVHKLHQCIDHIILIICNLYSSDMPNSVCSMVVVFVKNDTEVRPYRCCTKRSNTSSRNNFVAKRVFQTVLMNFPFYGIYCYGVFNPWGKMPNAMGAMGAKWKWVSHRVWENIPHVGRV